MEQLLIFLGKNTDFDFLKFDSMTLIIICINYQLKKDGMFYEATQIYLLVFYLKFPNKIISILCMIIIYIFVRLDVYKL